MIVFLLFQNIYSKEETKNTKFKIRKLVNNFSVFKLRKKTNILLKIFKNFIGNVPYFVKGSRRNGLLSIRVHYV